jgi:hypothetical protein
MEKNKIVFFLSEKNISKISQVASYEELNIQTANNTSNETCMVYVRNKKNETYVISVSEEGLFINNMLAAFEKLEEYVKEEKRIIENGKEYNIKKLGHVVNAQNTNEN